MESSRPHFAALYPKSFEEFAFLQEDSKSFLFKRLFYRKILGYIGNFEVTSKNLKKYRKLSKYFKDSELSKEIRSKDIELTPEFSKELQYEVDKMAKTLKHPKQVQCQLSKMVIYEKGGHFESDIDAKHKPNMIFMLSLEIFVNHETQGGILTMNNQAKIPSPSHEKELSLVLFYHDVLHEVTEVREGTRIFLFFNVLELEKIVLFKEIETDDTKFWKGLTKFKDSGVRKIGLLFEHYYYGETKENIVLKGKDAIFFEILKQYCDNIDIVKVCIDKNSRVFRKEILNIMKKCDIFEKFYFKEDREDRRENYYIKRNQNQYYEKDYEDKTLHFKSLKPNFAQKNKNRGDSSKLINFDDENKFLAISRKFLLGDVVFLETGSENRLFFRGSEFFHGKVWKNLAFVVTLDFNLI